MTEGSGAVKVVRGGIERMEGRYVRFKTRQRVTADGGKSKLAAEGMQRTDATVESRLESGLESVRGGGLVVSGMRRVRGGGLVRRVRRWDGR